MFLPTKAHTKDIVEGQHKIRLGNRVPKDAVNLAYTSVPEVHADENLLITDLSNTILENSRNLEVKNLYTNPDTSLVLTTESGQYEFPTEDILLTNVFKESVPLYYAHELSYLYYDAKGPDQYGFYQKEGISLIDRYGKPVAFPYQVQLIANPDFLNLYNVMVYTPFSNEGGNEYYAVYNAVVVEEDGKRTTKAGYREPLNVKRVFQKTASMANIINAATQQKVSYSYYQARGSQPGYSKVYVPSPRIKDGRMYERFRYQVGLEVTKGEESYLYTTPWKSDEVLNPNFLRDDELENYENGYKKLTIKTAEKMMREIVPYTYFTDEEAALRYFVLIDNPNVESFFRADGSSEVYATTTSHPEQSALQIPIVTKFIKEPVSISSNVTFKIRPLKADPLDEVLTTFVMDNSQSMLAYDPNRAVRSQIIEGLQASMQQYYAKAYNGLLFFDYKTFDWFKSFVAPSPSLIKGYMTTRDDQDITKPIPAIDRAINILDQSPEAAVGKTHRVAIFVTDAQFDDFETLEERFQVAEERGVMLCFICFNNFEKMQALCKKYNTLCINALSLHLWLDLRLFYYRLAGLRESVELLTKPFKMDPTQNDRLLLSIDKDTFDIEQKYLDEDDRYGIEAVLDDDPWIPQISMYYQDKKTKETLPTYNCDTILKLRDLMVYEGHRFYLHSEAYDYSYSQTYAMQLNDTKHISVESPRFDTSKYSWYVRVKRGRFDRKVIGTDADTVYHYTVPEYYRQAFASVGYPIRAITNERPEILTANRIRVSCVPLYVTERNGVVSNATVKINGKTVPIKNYDLRSGIFELDAIIGEHDNVLVGYRYEEDSYEYRGYYEEKTKRFWMLDLNPSRGHYVTIRDSVDGEVKDVPSFTLINKTVYMYLRPVSKTVYKKDGTLVGHELIRNMAVFHSFERIEDGESVLLAELRVRPNSNRESIEVIDTRVRGGGLKEDISRTKMLEFENESLFYWDIGYHDGEPYPENAVVNIRVTRYVLKEYGGQFTRSEIEEKLNKHLGYGIFPIVEFIDDPNYLLQVPTGLTVEVIDIKEDAMDIEKPSFLLEVEE